MSRSGKSRKVSFRHLCFLLALGLGLVLAYAGPVEGRAPEQPDSERAAVNQAQALLDAGNLPAAVRLLRSRVELHPREVAPRVLLAAVYQARGNFKAAETELQTALKYSATNPQVLTRLGAIYDQTGHPEKAERLLAHAVKAARGTEYLPEARLAWATTLAELHRYPEAAAALRDVQPPQPAKQQIAFLRLKASVALGLGHANAAAEEMEVALRLAPEEKNLQLATAAAELDAHRWSEAAHHLSPIVALAPGNPELFYDLALAQFHAGELGAALESARHSRTIRDSGAVEDLLGDIEEKRGDSLDAVHRYQSAVSLDPKNKQYWMALSLELMRHETYGPALIVLEQAARRFPESLRMQLALGLDQYFLENYPGAIQALLEAKRRDPASSLPIDYLGEIQLQPPVTVNPAAIQAVCGYAEAHPQSGEIMAYCGALVARLERVRGKRKPSPDVLSRLRQAARTAPADAIARCELGKALEWADEWQSARTEMEACVRLQPDSAEAEYRLARIYLHLGETGLAKQAMKRHDEAVQNMVAANARRDASMKKFLYTLTQSSRSKL